MWLYSQQEIFSWLKALSAITSNRKQIHLFHCRRAILIYIFLNPLSDKSIILMCIQKTESKVLCFNLTWYHGPCYWILRSGKYSDIDSTLGRSQPDISHQLQHQCIPMRKSLWGKSAFGIQMQRDPFSSRVSGADDSNNRIACTDHVRSSLSLADNLTNKHVTTQHRISLFLHNTTHTQLPLKDLKAHTIQVLAGSFLSDCIL